MNITQLIPGSKKVKVAAFLSASALALGLSGFAASAADGSSTVHAGKHSNSTFMSVSDGERHWDKRGHHGKRGDGAGHGRMMRGLDLTQEQRDELFKQRHANAPALRELHKKVKESRRALRELSFSDSYDAAKAGQLADVIASANAQIIKMRAQSGNYLFQILTPEQRGKLKERLERRRHTKRT